MRKAGQAGGGGEEVRVEKTPCYRDWPETTSGGTAHHGSGSFLYGS